MEENKKLALLRILHILLYHSDERHPLKQEEIAEYLEKDYGIVVERKAIGRQLALLHEAYDAPNSPIVLISDRRRGTYIEQREFEDTELRLLIDGVLSSRHITAKHSKDLIEKLCRQSNKYFRSHVKNVYSVSDWNKTDNSAVFLNIELIDEAIERGLQLRFVYNKYGADKKLHQTSHPRVSPYQLILHNQRYYLMARHERFEDMHFYRLDRITEMQIVEDRALTPVREVKGYESGIDYKKLSTSLPYMFADNPEYVEFWVEEWAIDHVIDWFGKGIKIEKVDERYKVGVLVSPMAMEYWALQYVRSVEIISPASLRERVRDALEKGADKYRK
ncbi:MAG: WYL domain-containing protein [Clostridiales bacterium]|nr:WYL domain-containing protein [Clostridiales bacterium]